MDDNEKLIEEAAKVIQVEQSNDIAAIVFAEVKKVWPEIHPTLELRYGIADALWAAGFRRSDPQGEPYDAQVGAALESYWGYPDGYSRGQFEKMRAALRAAGGAR